ncbi:MAG: APC family permease [Candidatus Micrarchaeota archaeon]
MAKRLARRLSFADATLFEIGGIVGAGVFALIGLAAGAGGPAVVAAVALAGVVSLLTALSYAEISSALPVEGGEFEFAHRLVSPLAGKLTAAGWLVADVVSTALVGLAFGNYVSSVFPAVPARAAAWGVFFAAAAINAAGVKLSARANGVLSVFKVAVLVLFISIGLSHFNAANFAPLMPTGKTGVLAAAALFFFAYSGFGKITRLSEEVVGARKTLPRAIVASLCICTALYILVAVALIGSFGWQSAAASASPLYSAVGFLGYPWAAQVLWLGALAAMFTVILTNNAGISRILFAVGRRSRSLGRLGHVQASFGTPWKAVALAGALPAIIVFFVDLKGAAEISSALFLLYYAVVNAIAIFARSRKDWKPAFKTPLFPLLPLMGFLSCILLLAGIFFGLG